MVGLLVSWAAPVVALHLVSGAGQSFSTWNHTHLAPRPSRKANPRPGSRAGRGRALFGGCPVRDAGACLDRGTGGDEPQEGVADRLPPAVTELEARPVSTAERPGSSTSALIARPDVVPVDPSRPTGGAEQPQASALIQALHHAPADLRSSIKPETSSPVRANRDGVSLQEGSRRQLPAKELAAVGRTGMHRGLGKPGPV